MARFAPTGAPPGGRILKLLLNVAMGRWDQIALRTAKKAAQGLAREKFEFGKGISEREMGLAERRQEGVTALQKAEEERRARAEAATGGGEEFGPGPAGRAFKKTLAAKRAEEVYREAYPLTKPERIASLAEQTAEGEVTEPMAMRRLATFQAGRMRRGEQIMPEGTLASERRMQGNLEYLQEARRRGWMEEPEPRASVVAAFRDLREQGYTKPMPGQAQFEQTRMRQEAGAKPPPPSKVSQAFKFLEGMTVEKRQNLLSDQASAEGLAMQFGMTPEALLELAVRMGD